MAFVPTPFTTPIIAPNTYQATRSASYISPSQYRFAPTAVATNALVSGSSDQQVDSVASLAQVIARASSWVDDHCFHRSDGSLVASITVEQMWVTIKPTGMATFITNFKPLREIVGVAIGPSPGSVYNIEQNQASTILMGEKSFSLVGGYYSGVPTGFFGPWPSVNGQMLGIYSYIAGWPHAALASNVTAGSTTITVQPPVAGATALYGAYAGTALTIKDGARTETVVLASAPTGLTLNLVSPTKYAHTVPLTPDAILVTALPNAIEEACISMTNVLIKTQGMRAQVLPGSIGNSSPTQRQAMSRAGALGDFDIAEQLLKPYVTVYAH